MNSFVIVWYKVFSEEQRPDTMKQYTEMHGLQIIMTWSMLTDCKVIITSYNLKHLILEIRAPVDCFWLLKKEEREGIIFIIETTNTIFLKVCIQI